MEDENRNVEKGDLNEDESIYVHIHFIYLSELCMYVYLSIYLSKVFK